MKLTREEQGMLGGKYGGAAQKAMELLVAVGECFDAERMVPVSSVHLASVSATVAGKGGEKFITGMAEMGGRFVVPTSVNPACIEPWSWKEGGFDDMLYQRHLDMSGAVARMGGYLCYTCSPYIIGHTPRQRQHVAWGESSAVVYVNSVLAGRTNREGGATGLASAITGRTPYYGYHIDENRYGQLKVEVNTELKGEIDYATLGFFAGKIAQDRVTVFTGIPPSITDGQLISLSAGVAVTGSVSLCHVVGITPEAPTEKAAFGPNRISSSDILQFGPGELKETREHLSKAGPEEAQLVILGCPHPTIAQLKDYAGILQGRKVKDGIEVWILVANVVRRYAEDIGCAGIIESSGVKLASGACPNMMPRGVFKKHGISVVATDSPKLAYYVPALQDVRAYCGSLEEMVDAITRK